MFNLNDSVKLKNTNTKGIIIRKNKTNNTNTYLIRLNNNMLTNVLEDNLEKVTITNSNVYIKTKYPHNQVTFKLNEYTNFEPEIMLRHQYAEEALENLDSFIYQAISNNAKRLKIIHGKNGGILRNAVHKYLTENKNVVSYHLGDYFEGSYGVTIAILK